MRIDPRHEARKLAFLKLYSEFFSDQNAIPTELVAELPSTAEADINMLKNLIDGVKASSDQINTIIKQCAPEWPLERIAKIDLAILRVSVYELLATKVNTSVIINEAVELAKEFGGENSGKFVNGVLGSVADTLSTKQTTSEVVKQESQTNEAE